MTILNDNSTHIENLIHEYLSGRISESGKEELFRWLVQDAANINLFNQISDIWLSSSVFQDAQQFNTDDAFNRVKEKIVDVNALSPRPKKRVIQLSWLKAAAILLPLILLSGLSTKLLFPGKVNYSESPFLVEVPYGSKSTVTLPDGSKVVLNSGSKLTCKEGFGKMHRVLNLVGEGYFKVAKNKELPFVVHAGNLDVMALGTEFNVKAYPEDKIVETILIHGSIQVSKKGDSKTPLVLKRKQILVYNKMSDSIFINIAIEKRSQLAEKPLPTPPTPKVVFSESNVDPAIYTSWKEDSWNIYREELWSLAIKLERKYDIKVHFENEDLKKIKFTGTLRDESIEQVLAAIRLASPIEFKVKGKQVELSENKYLMEQYKQYYKN